MEESSFVDNILTNKEYYKNWLGGKSKLNGGIYSKEDIANVVAFIKDKQGNYFILVEGEKRIAERQLDTHLRVRFVKSMGNARPNNPKQRSHQGELPFSIKEFWKVSEECINDQPLLNSYLNRAKATTTDGEDQQEYYEGRKSEYNILRQSRNKKARNKCLEKSKGKCYVCNFDFGQTYGDIGKGFLEVHHKIPIHQYDSEHRIETEDLYAVCPNCHRMIHRTKEPMDVDILKEKVEENRVKQSEKYDYYYNTIYIVDSFSENDSWGPIYAYGKSLFEELCSYKKRENLSNIKCRYQLLQCKNNWDNFWYELEELCKQGERPIIHFISHGTKDGQKIGNDIIPWKEVVEQFYKINGISHNLFVTMNVCYSSCLLDYISENTFIGCVCAFKEVYRCSDLKMLRFMSFYEAILNGQPLRNAIDAFKNEILHEPENKNENHWIVYLQNSTENRYDLLSLEDWNTNIK